MNRPTAYYHVMIRTAQQEMYLGEDYVPGFKRVMLDIFQSMAEVYYVKIFAWAIMDNHYHLCLEVKKPPKDMEDLQLRFERLQSLNQSSRKWQPELADKFYKRFTDLSEFMRSVNLRIAKAFNRARGTKGHLWGDRFLSKIIENKPSLLRVMAYIEQNPVRAGLCRFPSQYPWCSAGWYKTRLLQGELVEFPAFEIFTGETPDQMMGSYIDLVDELAFRMHPPPPTVGARVEPPRFRMDPAQYASWKQDFEAGKPEDWSKQGFGSSAFQREVSLAEKTKLQNRALKRGEAMELNAYQKAL
nr:transposase [Acanthopleuribacter pedis]